MKTILEVNQLSLMRQQLILQDISFKIKSGELVMLVGPNGAGKSSLMQCIAGVLTPSAGNVLIEQQSSDAWTAKQWAQHISYLPQNNPVNFALTVPEVINLGGLAHELQGEVLAEKSQQAITLWQLEEFKQREVRRLSGGEQQRCHMARSWLQMQSESSLLWALDEPLSALDLQHQKLSLQQIKAQTEQQKSVLMVAHDLNLVRHYADRVLLIDKGCLVAEGRPEEVLSAKNISRVFQVEARVEGNNVLWY